MKNSLGERKQMEELKTNEYPQIKYHITYDESLTLKDLEDLINLIRISTNNALEEIGIPRAKANSLQKIEKIEPGSIQMIMETIQEIIEMVEDIASVIGLARKIGIFIRNRITAKRERSNRNPKEDKKVYEKYEVTVEVEEESNPMVYIVHIHVCKRKLIN